MCPLPIDWLDLLEGRPSEANLDHIVTCPSCTALVERLQLPAEQAPVRAISWPLGPASRSWTEGSQPHMAFGQIWLSSPSYVEGDFSYETNLRVPLVILEFDERHDGSWVDAVPLWTEPELSTPSDLLLDADATTLETPFRAMFDLQCRLAVRQLEGCVGALTLAGREVVQTALADYQVESHGYAVADDPRVAASTDSLRIAVGALQSFALHQRDIPVPRHTGSIVSMGTHVSRPVSFRWEAERTPFHPDLELAASTDLKERRFVLEFKDGLAWFRGELRHDLRHGDLLLLDVEVTEGINTPVSIVIRTSTSEAASSPFLLMPNAEAMLTQGAGITLEDIESVEVV